jgi:hypothetical protein
LWRCFDFPIMKLLYFFEQSANSLCLYLSYFSTLITIIFVFLKADEASFDVELRLSPRWVGGNIRSSDPTKAGHILNAYIVETNNRKVINNTSLDSL